MTDISSLWSLLFDRRLLTELPPCRENPIDEGQEEDEEGETPDDPSEDLISAKLIVEKGEPLQLVATDERLGADNASFQVPIICLLCGELVEKDKAAPDSADEASRASLSGMRIDNPISHIKQDTDDTNTPITNGPDLPVTPKNKDDDVDYESTPLVQSDSSDEEQQQPAIPPAVQAADGTQKYPTIAKTL